MSPKSVEQDAAKKPWSTPTVEEAKIADNTEMSTRTGEDSFHLNSTAS